jgi:hypothetical protein
MLAFGSCHIYSLNNDVYLNVVGFGNCKVQDVGC